MTNKELSELGQRCFDKGKAILQKLMVADGLEKNCDGAPIIPILGVMQAVLKAKRLLPADLEIVLMPKKAEKPKIEI